MSSTKKTILAISLTLFIIGSIIGAKTLLEKLNTSSSTITTNQENNSIVVSVEGFAKNPYSYSDKEIRLEGVVSFVYPESQMIVLIGNKEYASCGVVTCAINQIPVSYAGLMPKVKDFIVATGKVSQTNDGKLLFKATEIKPQ